MVHKSMRFLLVLALLYPCSELLSAQGAPPLSSIPSSGTVRRLTSKSLDSEALRQMGRQLGLRPGDSFTRAALDTKIRSLYVNQLWENISILGQPYGRSALDVQIEASPFYRLRDLQIVGADKQVIEEAGAAALLSVGSVFTQEALHRVLVKLKSLYVAHGYQDAQLDAQINADPPLADARASAAVVIHVNPKTATRVRNITLKGVDSGLNGRIRDEIALKPSGVLSLALLEQSRSQIEEILLKEKYLGSRLEGVTQTAVPHEHYLVDVEFRIHQGHELEIEFKGNTVWPSWELKKLLTDELYSQPDVVEQLSQRVREKYKSEGYSFCTVVPHREPQKRGVEKVDIQIDEGARVKLQSIEWVGGRSVNHLFTLFKENAPQSVVRGYYVESDFLLATQGLQVTLKGKGYLNARVKKPIAVFSEDKKWVRVLIDVEEGSRARLAYVHLVGNEAFAMETLLAVSGLKIGDTFHSGAIEEGRKKIEHFYQMHGYVDVRIAPPPNQVEVALMANQKDIRVEWQVIEGLQYFVGNVRIEGNRFTKIKIIEREILFHTGDILNPDHIAATEEGISVLGLFSNVNVQVNPAESGSRARNIVIKVKEMRRGSGDINLGSAYEQPYFRVRSFADIAYRNLLGLNHTATIHTSAAVPITNYGNGFQIPFVEYSFLVGYQSPYPWDIPVTFSASGGINSFEVVGYFTQLAVETQTMLETKIQKTLSRHFSAFYRLFRFERINIRTFDYTIPSQSATIGSLGPGINADFRNDPFNPTFGTYHSLYLELATPYFLSQSNVDYIMGLSRNHFYVPLFYPFYFAWYLGVGLAHSFLAGQPIPEARLINELALGGSASIRGFSYGRFVSPDTSVDTAFLNVRFELSGEVIHNVRGATFLDSGQLYPNFIPALRHDGIGLGIRYRTPIGPFAIDIAQGLGPDRENVKFYFTIGPL